MNNVKMTSHCLHGLSPFLLSFSSTACNLEMQCSTPMHVDELPEATTTLMLMHKKERYCKILANRFLYDCQRCLFIYDLWSCPNCSKLMPKSEKHLCQYHAMLGFPVNHIVSISKPKQAIFYLSVSDRL